MITQSPHRCNSDIFDIGEIHKDDQIIDGYINVTEKLSYSERQTIVQASQNINSKLQTRGYDGLQLFTITPPSTIRDIYEHDKNVINVINSLINELELSKKISNSHEKVSNRNIREKDYWEASAGHLEVVRIKNERRIRDLEVEILKLKFTIDDLKERKKGVENKVREIRNEWETYRNQVNRDKRKAELDREELVDKIKLKTRSGITRGNKQIKLKQDNVKYSEMIMNLLKDKNEARYDFYKLYGFNKNLYNCLEKLKASDGNCPIDSSFLVGENELNEINISDENPSHLLDQLDYNFVKVLNDIKNEPFGSNDTFRFKKIGVEKQREIYLLKEQLNTLQDNYDKVVNTMQEWKEWRNNSHNII